MRIAYLECFAGISGDMFLGALIDAGVDAAVMQAAVDTLGVGAKLRVEKVDRSGIHSTKVTVMVEGESAEAAAAAHDHTHTETHTQEHTHTDEHGHSHTHVHTPTHSNDDSHGDSHEPPHEHAQPATESAVPGHTHEHQHGRSLSVIRKMIQGAPLTEPVRATALRAFELLGASEAKIHNVPVERIHFHEVGAVDAIADIVAASAGVHALGVDMWMCSPLNVGGGMVDCAHGRFPVPAPATADLLKGAPTYSSGLQMELVTPTGAALVRALGCSFGAAPAMRVEQIGYGAGTRDPKGFANVLRLNIGEADGDAAASETVIVMEAAVDDLNPQVTAYFTEQALLQGALDVMCTAVQMKKNRPGTLITVLCRPAHASALQSLLFHETSTLGVRVREERRVFLARESVTVRTEWGEIRVKVGSLCGELVNAAPEFEDCRRVAEAQHIPVKRVMEAALAAYRATQVR